MKRRFDVKTWTVLGSALFALALLAGCTMPTDPSGGTAAETTPNLTFVNDMSRGQALFVNEEGESFDIVTVEDGETVRCVEAFDIVILSEDAVARAASRSRVKALIIGMRHDGLPGVWQITEDDKLKPVAIKTETTGTKVTKESSAIVDEKEKTDPDSKINGLFGWEYTAVDGEINPDEDVIMVGEAFNPNGFKSWFFRIQPKTRVGVYWYLEPDAEYGYKLVHYAQVIGTRENAHAMSSSSSGSHYYHTFLRRILSSVRLFFLDFYDEYLDSVSSVVWDEDRAAFVVQGAFQDTDLEALIQQAAVTEIQEPTGGTDPPPPVPTVYERLFVETYAPDAGFDPDTDMVLFDQDGNVLARSAGMFAAKITYQPSDRELKTGDVFYAVVTPGSDVTQPAPFAIRSAALETGESIPMRPGFPGNPDVDPYEEDEGDQSPFGGSYVPPALDAEQELIVRILDPPAGTPNPDQDWIKIVLP